MRKILFILLLFVLISFPVSAAEETGGYKDGFEMSGAEDLPYSLPQETRETLEQFGINPKDENWVNTFTSQGVFEHIWDLFFVRSSSPLKSGGIVLGIILISAAFPSFCPDGKKFEVASFAVSISVALCIIHPLWNAISAASNAIKGCASFMLSFVPVFAAIVSVSGGVATSVSMSALLLTAAEVVSSAAAFIILPAMGGYLAMSLCSSVSPLIATTNIAERLRTVAFWILSFISTVFVGILGIQTVVNSAADSLVLKTSRFIIGTSVPIAGAALSEAASTLFSSFGLLRSSIGIYGVVALSAILLPIVIELIVWRLVLLVSLTVSELTAQPSLTKILKSVDMMLSVLIAIILLIGAMFIISLTVVVNSGKSI